MEELLLRDIHQPLAPPWWPPAPGWWLLLTVLVSAAGLLAFFRWRRWRKRREWMRLFDTSMAQARSPSERVGMLSALLRRAARTRNPMADRLQGEQWLAFIDDVPGAPPLDPELGQLLLDGGFRPDADPDQVERLQQAVRGRFLWWAGGRR